MGRDEEDTMNEKVLLVDDEEDFVDTLAERIDLELSEASRTYA